MFADSIWETEEHACTKVGKNIVYVLTLRIKVYVWEENKGGKQPSILLTNPTWTWSAGIFIDPLELQL